MDAKAQAGQQKPFPWGPVAVGAGVLVGGGLLYQSWKKKKVALAPAATKIAPKPGTTTTTAKPYTPSPLPKAPTVTPTAPGSTMVRPPGSYDTTPTYSAPPSSSSSQSDEQAKQQAADAAAQAEQSAAKLASSLFTKSMLPSADAADALGSDDSTSGGGLYIGSVRIGSVRTVDDVRRHVHKALADHPDYAGIGFCRVGGEVGLVVASKNRPMRLPGRIGGVPIVAGRC